MTGKQGIDVALCWGWIDAVPAARAMLARGEVLIAPSTGKAVRDA